MTQERPWAQSEQYVMETLRRHDEALREMAEQLVQVRITTAINGVKVALWGGMGASIPSGIAVAAVLLMQ